MLIRTTFTSDLKRLRTLVTGLMAILCVFGSSMQTHHVHAGVPFHLGQSFQGQQDSTGKDSLRYPLRDRKPGDQGKIRQIDLKDPSNFRTEVKYDPKTNTYTEQRYLGTTAVGAPRSQSFSEFLEELNREQQREYFRQKSQATNFVRSSGIIPKLYVSPPIFDKIFGGGLIDIRPSGSASVTFGGNFNTVRNPAFSARQQKNGQFDFRMQMQINVSGQIGDRVKINTNYNTEATFEFENQMKLNWEGQEDDIIKKLELGNVSLPLNGSLIQGGQSLFGLKTAMQFGKLTVTTIATQQKGERRETQVTGGAQVTQFNIQAHEYDVNRHFFLAHFFKDQYDQALSTIPVIQSGVLINYIEVWVTNRGRNFNNNRNLIAYTDLGENDPYNPNIRDIGARSNLPDNDANRLFNIINNDPQLQNSNEVINRLKSGYANLDMQFSLDYNILTNARQLSTNEFTYNERLGYISLNTALNNDEILAVAFEYTYNGVRYQVGEFARDNPPTGQNAGDLTVKMLKSTILRTNHPMWDLMMKNIYSLGTYNLQTNDFNLNVVYADDPSGADLNYLPVQSKETAIFQKQLITVLNLDNINRQLEAKPDGVFDLIEGITIQSGQGRIIFPVREPFGQFLRSKFTDPNGRDADYYAFGSLYDSTKWLAQQDVTHNKFFLRGSYKGNNSSEISLNAFNVPKGSVRVTANGNLLTEGTDYIVDYTLGKVKIINEGVLNSGAVIKVSSESNTLFNIQQKTLVGTRLDYKHNRKLFLGATLLHMTERPLTPKVNIGSEPLLNTIWGVDGTYNTPSRWLTRVVDRLPFIETKEESNFSFQGEFAQIIPWKPRTMGERGTSYIDDFEGAETPYDLRFWGNWHLAATPQGQADLFPETQGSDTAINSKRAKLAWHMIDPLYQSCQLRTPEHICDDVDQRSNHFVRSVPQPEVFPQINLRQGTPQQMPTLDLAYYPNERGQFNYNATDLLEDGTLANPKENWGGITRRIETTDFESANISYIEIWMLDPFVYNKALGIPTDGGKLYINLGNVSEDVVPDNRRGYENGLYPGKVDTTRLGVVPSVAAINAAFDNDEAVRSAQDVGLDGLDDAGERQVFSGFLNTIRSIHGENSKAYQDALNDPSADNYDYHLEPDFANSRTGILDRYKNFNGTQGNATLDRLADGTPKSATVRPDDEDINADYTLNLNEEYFQYEIELNPTSLRVGQNYVTDSVVVTPQLVDPGHIPNEVTWYQLKIPVFIYDKAVGGITDFKSIRFMRMYLKGFEDSVVIRFAQLQLIRAEWREYLKDLKWPPQPVITGDLINETDFTISTVNIEENSIRKPIPYKVPPGFSRVLDPTQPGAVQQNEQSLSLAVKNLKKGDSRAAFKATNFDIRNYRYIKMFVHAEGQDLKDGDVRAFVRIGTDLERNYYQYEIPLRMTPNGTADPQLIWPKDNEIVIDLEKFYALKLNRQKGGDNFGYFEEFTPEGHKISMVGLPDLSNVRSIMLGVMNPEDNEGSPERLDAEVWFNELRLTDFTNRGGYAARARMVAKMADFATISLSGSYDGIGFGGIDKRLNERNLEEIIQYDVASNFELGKFFPQKWGVAIPMFIGWNEIFVNPKFYPLNPDILMRTAINNAETPQEKDAIREAAQDYTSRYSVNFSNVRKNRTGGNMKQHLWDIENFNVSYAYQNMYRRNQVIEENIVKTYRGSLGYNFTKNVKPWEPFKTKIKNKNLQLIKDFNLFFMPQSINARFDVDRRYSELQNRNNDNFRAIVPRLYDKTFQMTRVYGVNYNLTRGLKFNYAATVNSRVEEPFGALDTREKIDTVRRNFWAMGLPNTFNQSINGNYTLPFGRTKWLNWMNVNATYTGNYNWTTAPPAFSGLGNTIQNSQTLGVNASLSFISLYNRIPAIRKLTAPPPKSNFKKSAEEEEGKEGEEKKKDKGPSPTVRALVKGLIMIKNVQVNISKTNGTTLPGFIRDFDVLGQNFGYNAPGFPFILGFQDPQIRYRLAENGHMSTDPRQNNRYIQLDGININGSATIQPSDGLRITLNIDQRRSTNTSSNFRWDDSTSQYLDFGLQQMGTFSTTFGMWRTLFEDRIVDEEYNSPVFDQFRNNRFVIAERLQNEQFSNDPRGYRSRIGERDTSAEGGGYPLGYLGTHQDVLYYSFIAAYSGKNAASMSLNPFPRIPVPSWRINWNGLSNIDAIKEYFTNISFSHAYSSNLNINSFVSSLVFQTDSLIPGKSLASEYQFQDGISLIERLTPLIGIDVAMKMGLTLKFEYKTDRTLNLQLRNFQMIEIRNKEWVFGAGYRTSKVRLPFKVRGERLYLENDVDIRMDMSVRDGVTLVRQIDQDLNQPTAGMRTFSLRPNLNYMINDKLNFTAFYTRNVNNPKTTNSFPTALTQFGVTLRYTIQ